MVVSEILATQLDDTRAWTLKLIEDLKGDDWSFAPGTGLAHPLWLCGHLAVAQHLLIHVRCLDTVAVDDEFIAHFPIGQPVKSANEHDYQGPAVILRKMDEVHASTLAVVRSMSDDLLSEPAYGMGGAEHPHYRDKRGAVTHCLRHEAFHAGQIATIRRLLGKPFLR